MLTKADDYPIHQTAEPIAYAGTDRNFYDRYFFNGYSPDGEVFFAAALGVYPHLNVMDAAFSIVRDGVQHSVHASRVLHMERLDTKVGPIEVEVIEPLKVLRVTCADLDNGIEADVRFTARVAPIEEPRFTRRSGSVTVMDVTRMTQNGSYDGFLSVDGERLELNDAIRGTRDRSWGVRGVGARDPRPNPYAGEPQFYWLWAPLNFDHCATFYHVNTDAAGEPWNTRGVIAPLDGDVVRAKSVSSKLTLASGTRHAASACIHLDEVTLELAPQFNFYMKGLGYTHPKWGHGVYHGELETEYEAFKLDEIAPTEPANLHIQAFCKVTMNDGAVTHDGAGVLEQMIIGRHAPSGLQEVMDMAP